MKVSYSWLKEYVDTKIDPKKIAHLLTMAGVNVASCENVGGDYIFELEITANRPDCLSVLGVARELAALLGKSLKVPKEIKDGKKQKVQSKKQKPSFNVTLKNPELCFRYTARIIKDVEVGPSPDWLKNKIISVGLRPVNNIVDITNFVLFETGQPLHAFDLDRIKEGIVIRRAARDEKIITIDNVPRTMTGDTLVIADGSEPIAIAGVMGGLKTEVSNMTKNILLESAFFDPVSVRHTSRALGIASESSYRFERKINNDMVVKASERAGALIEEVTKGKKGEFFDVGKKASYSKNISLSLKKTNSLLGVPIKKNEAIKILKALEFSVSGKNNFLKITVPGFREDVKNDIDVIEEIARIYGYEKIPVTIPRIVGNTTIKEPMSLFQEKLSNTLIRLGLNEIITYALINRNKIKGLDVPPDQIVAIKNPLSIDQEIMRPTLLPGMLGVISYNFNRRAKELSLFEIGNTYKEKGNSYIEEPVLSIGLAGIKRDNWRSHKQEYDFFDIKGMFEKLLDESGLKGVIFKKGSIPGFNKNITSIAEQNGDIIGYLGEVGKSICGKFDIEKNVFYAEIYITKLFKKISLSKRYASYGRYPSVVRDISMVMDKSVTSQELENIIKEMGKDLVKDVSLVDCYKGKQIPENKRALLYRIEYRSDEKTLEDSEVDRLHSDIKNTLSEKLNISFR